MVFKMVDDLDLNHKETKAKLTRLTKDYQITYLAEMKKMNLLNTAISLSSSKNLNLLRNRYHKCSTIIKNF